MPARLGATAGRRRVEGERPATVVAPPACRRGYRVCLRHRLLRLADPLPALDAGLPVITQALSQKTSHSPHTASPICEHEKYGKEKVRESALRGHWHWAQDRDYPRHPYRRLLPLALWRSIRFRGWSNSIIGARRRASHPALAVRVLVTPDLDCRTAARATQASAWSPGIPRWQPDYRSVLRGCASGRAGTQ